MADYKVGSRIEYALSIEFSSNGDIVCIHADHILVLDDFNKKVVTMPKSDILTVLNF